VPELPGSFDGLELHSHDYRTPEPFAGKDVVVLGMGCSATELACEIAGVARSVTLAPRTGADVTGRRIGPMPIDWLDSKMNSRLPWRLRRRTMRVLFRLAGGNAVKAGLPSGPDRCGDKPVAISDNLVRCIRCGQIAVGAPVTELRGDRVGTAGGDELAAQAILYGTGYRAEFPFLPAELDPPSLDRAELYRGIASPAAEGLFFIGLAFTLGALIPVFEAQANWTAEILAGRLLLPSEEVMRESIRRDADVCRRDFDGRIAVAWDRVRYQRALEREAKRAARQPGSAPRRAEAATLR
jgi:hypothetical protein